MKTNFLLSFALIILAGGCGNAEKKSGKTVAHTPQVCVWIYDLTISTDYYAVLTNEQIQKAYCGIGQNGGGRFYGLHIMTNSAKQEPIAGLVPFLEQMPIKGNPYQQANREKKNKELAAEFEMQRDTFITTVASRLIVPKKHQFSDVKNALELARKILENPMYSTYAKKLLIISDMENDTPPKQGMDEMVPVHFKGNVQILLIRPSDRVNLERMLPGVSYSIYTTINDAIDAMFHQ